MTTAKPKPPKPKIKNDFLRFRDRILRLAVIVKEEEPEPVASPTSGAFQTVKRKTTLYYTNPAENSDKTYTVEIVQDFPSSLYHVNYEHGKRGKTQTKGRKTKNAVSEYEAQRVANELISEKMKGGYTMNVSGKPFSK